MKKITSMILIIMLVVSCSMTNVALASSDTSGWTNIRDTNMTVKNTSEENMNALEKFSRDQDASLLALEESNRSELDLSFLTENNEKDYTSTTCKAKGSFTLLGSYHTFDVSGEVDRVSLPDGNVILIGGLSGWMDDSENPENSLSLTLCYNENTEENYIPMCIGTYGVKDEEPLLIEFGKPFKGLNEATMEFQKKAETEIQDNLIEMSQQNVQPLAVDATVKCLNAITTYYSGSSVMYTYLYGSKEAMPSGSWRQNVKMQVNLTNFANKYNANLPPVTGSGGSNQVSNTQGHSIRNAWLCYSNSKNTCRIVDIQPAAQSSTTKILMPTFFIPWGAVAYAATYAKIPIAIKGISHSNRNGLSSVETEIWNSNGVAKIKTTAKNLDAASKSQDGVAIDFMVSNNLPTNGVTTATCYSKAAISFTEVYVDGSIAPRTVTITGNKISQSLFSKS